jgi:hypothetical protein
MKITATSNFNQPELRSMLAVGAKLLADRIVVFRLSLNERSLRFNTVFALATVALLSSCSGIRYQDVHQGELKGRLFVEWIDEDRFVFRPDPKNPLTFTRRNKDKIVPGLMVTDGGSIPRPFRGLKNYSPWGYAPGYIVHDWLFHIHVCKMADHDRYGFEDTATILAEIIKTLMEHPDPKKRMERDEGTLFAIHAAVSSPIAREVWNGSTCQMPPERAATEAAAAEPSVKIRQTIEF